jgi:hypothetical protein
VEAHVRVKSWNSTTHVPALAPEHAVLGDTAEASAATAKVDGITLSSMTYLTRRPPPVRRPGRAGLIDKRGPDAPD